MIDKSKLSFNFGNAKLSKGIATFSLPAGHSCPFAKACFSKADRLTGKITDGKDNQFRCFAASDECLYTNVRNARWTNYLLLKKAGNVEKMAGLIQQSLPLNVVVVRVHVSGDFYSEKYFLAWLNVALNNPAITFYGYTKALPFLVKYKKYIPSNFRFTASKGGTCDNLIVKHKLKYAEVVFSPEEAEEKGMEIDHDDSKALANRNSFALLLHGNQPAGSRAAGAKLALKHRGITGYNEHSPRFKIPSKPITIYVGIPIQNSKNRRESFGDNLHKQRHIYQFPN